MVSNPTPSACWPETRADASSRPPPRLCRGLVHRSLGAARVAAAPPVNAPPGHPELGIMTAARLRPPYTFAFPRRPSDLPSTTRWLDGFRPAGQEQVAAFRAAFAAWTAVSGGTLAFVELPPKQAAQAAVRVAETTDSMGLHADGITPFFGFTPPGRVVLCQAALALRGRPGPARVPSRAARDRPHAGLQACAPRARARAAAARRLDEHGDELPDDTLWGHDRLARRAPRRQLPGCPGLHRRGGSAGGVSGDGDLKRHSFHASRSRPARPCVGLPKGPDALPHHQRLPHCPEK